MLRHLLSRPVLAWVLMTLTALWVPVAQAVAGSFTVSPSVAELGAGITVTYLLEDYDPTPWDIIAIYASGEVSVCVWQV